MKSIEADTKNGGGSNFRGSGLDRRDLMKLGAGAFVTALSVSGATAQDEVGRVAKGGGPTSRPEGLVVKTGAGWKNDSGRASGNGPMDDISLQIVSYVASFSESNLTKPDLVGMGTYMIDSMAALMAGFETESSRIGARIGRMMQSELKSTILGYGVITSPQAAALTNSLMTRHTDFNDSTGHSSVINSGILAVGEALHSTGLQVLAAIALGTEVLEGLQGAEKKMEGQGVRWDSKYYGLATALAVGKLMDLNEDKLANALSIALVPHMPLNVSHVGALSHFKSMHAAIAVHDGVFAALMAREGMTGPAQPFEGRDGLLDSVTGPFRELRLPIRSDGRLTAGSMRFKRYPTDGDHQAILAEAIPAIREWTKVEDIVSINIEIPWSHWLENADPPKWDPRNGETADHSLPYVVAAALKDGDVYLDAYTPKRYLNDVAIRQLMDKITCQGNSDFDRDQSRITVRTKTGGELVKEVSQYTNLSHDEVIAKFKRVCAYISVDNKQRDRALETWSNLQKVPDIAEPIRDLAHFGKPLPL